MKNLIVASMLLTSSLAFAARQESGNNNKVYFDTASGRQISALEADKAATLDKAVLQCEPVEKVCNERTGKCTLKKVK